MRQTLFPPKKPTLAFPRPSSRLPIHFLVKKYRFFILKMLPFAVLRGTSNLALKRPGQWRRRLNLWSPESLLGQTISHEGNVLFSISKLYGFVVKSLAVKHFPRIHNCLQLLSNLPTAKSTFFHLCIWNILWQVTYYEAQYSKTLVAFVIVKKTNYLFRNKSQRSHHYLCEPVSLTLRYEGGNCLGR